MLFEKFCEVVQKLQHGTFQEFEQSRSEMSALCVEADEKLSGLTPRAADSGDAFAKTVTMVNSLSNMLIDAASKGYVSSNDLDYANECLDDIITKLEPRRR